MQIESLKDLQKLIKACRDLGVAKIEIDGIKLELGSLPVATRKPRKVVEENDFEVGGIGANTKIPTAVIPDSIDTDELSDEQKMFWSAEGGQTLGTGETL